MKTSHTLVAVLIAFVTAEAQLPLVERLRERIAERRANAGTAATTEYTADGLLSIIAF